MVNGLRFEPRTVSSSFWVIVWVREPVVLKGTVVGDWCFGNLSGSHLQPEKKVCNKSGPRLIGQFSCDEDGWVITGRRQTSRLFYKYGCGVELETTCRNNMKLAVGLDQNFNLGPLDFKSRALALLSLLPACFAIMATSISVLHCTLCASVTCKTMQSTSYRLQNLVNKCLHNIDWSCTSSGRRELLFSKDL